MVSPAQRAVRELRRNSEIAQGRDCRAYEAAWCSLFLAAGGTRYVITGMRCRKEVTERRIRRGEAGAV